MTTGIYKLSFTDIDEVYIGQSINIETRFTNHKYLMKSGKASVKLQTVYNALGEFPILEILEVCSEEDLDIREDFYILKYDTVANGLNYKDQHGHRTTICGENAKLCNYNNDQIRQAFLLLIQYPKYTREAIQELTGVHTNTLKDISAGISHKWLYKEFPNEYEILKNLKGNRNKGQTNASAVYSKDQILDVFFTILNNPTMPLSTIAKLLDINYATVKSVASGINHKWLENDFPEEYATVISRVGNRPAEIGKSAADKGKVYPPLISPDGKVYIVTNIAKFARDNGLNSGHLGAVLRGKEVHHKGWKLDTKGI